MHPGHAYGQTGSTDRVTGRAATVVGCDQIDELDEVRERVLQVSREARGPLVGELKRIEALVADAQIAVEADSAQARSTLYRLVVEMEEFMTNAGMFMGSDH